MSGKSMDTLTENQAARAATRRMREESAPTLPPALAEAAAQRAAAGTPALRELRQAALKALTASGLPQSGAEDFTFIRLGDVLPHLSALPAPEASHSGAVPKTQTMPTLEGVRGLIFPESRESYLVLLDGEYAPGLSHPGSDYKVTPLEAGLTGLEPGARAALLGLLERETDAAASLAALFSPQPLLVQVAPKAAPAAPLQILHLATSALTTRRDAFLAFAAGRLSESRVLVRHSEAALTGPADGGKGGMSNVHAVLLLDEGASVKWLEASPEGARNENEIHFHKLTASLERDARLFAAVASTGARVARNAYAVDLRGPGAEADLNGATVLAGARQAHQFLQVRHLAPNCQSRQHFKTVAADRSRASVDGTILVAEGAQQTNAQQLINNLMLSDEARADAKPRLLIHADDVKCAHGATTGKLDDQQRFYLESRGLPAAQARTLLTLAFIAEIVERAARAEGLPAPAEGSARGRDGVASGFRAHLDATLLDTLRRRLAAPEGAA